MHPSAPDDNHGSTVLLAARHRAASTGGSVLAAATSLVALVRRAAKPLHPHGAVLGGRLVRTGSQEKTGVDWLDEAGEDEVRVRLSRAIGLPEVLPDVHGLAIRVEGVGGGDLLLASTGLGRLSRFILTVGREPRGRPMTTLLPYRTVSGALLLSATAVDTESYELAWARPSGKWHAFGVLRLGESSTDERTISFDPVRRQVEGLSQYPSVVRLREPAYRRARRSRGVGE
ncbi:MAG: putative phosphodiesterase [Aeromicrobium sp.]|nr:putative phosphodiesterase [Aeromicrobium sp.]